MFSLSGEMPGLRIYFFRVSYVINGCFSNKTLIKPFNLYIHAGIITEMYDHTNFEENKLGFTGFLHGDAASYSQETRKVFVLRHLGS